MTDLETLSPAPVTNCASPPLRDRVRPVVAGLLFAYLVLVVCPIRCWQQSDSVDGTWVFALNQAAAHGLTFGRDVVFTAGPLGYLAFPQVVGNNPVSGLLFQTAAWTVLILILADLFFRARFPLWNLVFFSALVGIASPFFWFNNMGLENLLLMGALVLLAVFRRQGGSVRYVTALVLLGIVPLIKLSGGVIGATALAGFMLDRAIQYRRRAWREAVLALLIPAATAACAWWWTERSWDTVVRFLKASGEIMSGYSTAMSLPSSAVDFMAAVLEVEVPETGELTFSCGMGMYRGALVAR